ncbi:hypothetical protein DFJ74DRAFT_687501 [Hyaloraphidium curvatum]|nr:hypothetical protein DFJ74DRAFT_687501 [Hyaloraphidium curvatum]
MRPPVVAGVLAVLLFAGRADAAVRGSVLWVLSATPCPSLATSVFQMDADVVPDGQCGDEYPFATFATAACSVLEGGIGSRKNFCLRGDTLPVVDGLVGWIAGGSVPAAVLDSGSDTLQMAASQGRRGGKADSSAPPRRPVRRALQRRAGVVVRRPIATSQPLIGHKLEDQHHRHLQATVRAPGNPVVPDPPDDVPLWSIPGRPGDSRHVPRSASGLRAPPAERAQENDNQAAHVDQEAGHHEEKDELEAAHDGEEADHDQKGLMSKRSHQQRT